MLVELIHRWPAPVSGGGLLVNVCKHVGVTHLVTFLIGRTPMFFDCLCVCGVQRGSKSNHSKSTCLKEIGQCL